MISSSRPIRVNERGRAVQLAPRGITQLEILLVLCVVLLNVSIFLPFVQESREKAQQSRCRENLKQLALALHQYHDVHESFPSGFDVGPNGDYAGWGWNLKVLPYVDSNDIYDRIETRLAEGIGVLPDAPELQRHLALFRCPSDAAPETVSHAMVVTEDVVDGIVTEGTADWENRLPRSNYFGNVGYLQVEVGGIQYNAAGTPTSTVPLVNAGSLGHTGTVRSVKHQYCDQQHFWGFFGQNSHLRMRDVVDGTSNTIMLGERYSPAQTSANAVGHGSWIGVPDCTRAQGLAMALGDVSVRINIGMPHREQTTGFGSQHHGGAMFALGDGSARYISERIDIVFYRNLSTVNDRLWPNGHPSPETENEFPDVLY